MTSLVEEAGVCVCVSDPRYTNRTACCRRCGSQTASRSLLLLASHLQALPRKQPQQRFPALPQNRPTAAKLASKTAQTSH